MITINKNLILLISLLWVSLLTLPAQALPNKKINVGILVFDQVETLDFTGPLEVFNLANDNYPKPIFNVYVISANEKVFTTSHHLKTFADFTLKNFPQPDILIVPGGPGVNNLLENRNVINFIKDQSTKVNLLASVCSGSLLLAKSGLLNNLKSTTHHSRMQQLRQISPTTTIVKNVKYVDNGKIISSAGVSSGIDMSLYIIAKQLNPQIALATANDMEYNNHLLIDEA
jgi:transcriptional regulator GlxA family with amidase domain